MCPLICPALKSFTLYLSLAVSNDSLTCLSTCVFLAVVLVSDSDSDNVSV